jgi:CBS domain-containing protein
MVEQYVYRFRYRMFPVVDDSGRLIGCVRTRRLRELPREEWDRQTAGAIAERCSAENTLPSHVDALRALTQMSRTGASRLMVVEGDHLLGVLSLQDLLRFLSLKLELEEAA